MADEKKTEKKPSDKSFLDKVKGFFLSIPKPFKRMYNELKLVTWPTKRKLIIYSAVVLVFMLFMMVVIGLFDLGSSALIRLIKPV